MFNEIAAKSKVSQKVQDEIVRAWERLRTVADVHVYDGPFPGG